MTHHNYDDLMFQLLYFGFVFGGRKEVEVDVDFPEDGGSIEPHSLTLLRPNPTLFEPGLGKVEDDE